jgi:hypothetical protein
LPGAHFSGAGAQAIFNRPLQLPAEVFQFQPVILCFG